jgi:hypothetical protein
MRFGIVPEDLRRSERNHGTEKIYLEILEYFSVREVVV